MDGIACVRIAATRKAEIQMANKLCQKCGKMRDEAKYFYLTRQGERYDLCKDCLTMHINAFDEETFLWVLKALDFPYNKTE